MGDVVNERDVGEGKKKFGLLGTVMLIVPLTRIRSAGDPRSHSPRALSPDP